MEKGVPTYKFERASPSTQTVLIVTMNMHHILYRSTVALVTM